MMILRLTLPTDQVYSLMEEQHPNDRYVTLIEHIKNSLHHNNDSQFTTTIRDLLKSIDEYFNNNGVGPIIPFQENKETWNSLLALDPSESVNVQTLR